MTGARSTVSVPAGRIATTPVPIAVNVKPVPAAMLLAGGSVMVYEPAPTRDMMLPDDVADIVALVLNAIPKETEIPLPTAQAVAPYFAMIAPAVLE